MTCVPRITLAALKAIGACKIARDAFQELFGTSVAATTQNARRWAACADRKGLFSDRLFAGDMVKLKHWAKLREQTRCATREEFYIAFAAAVRRGEILERYTNDHHLQHSRHRL